MNQQMKITIKNGNFRKNQVDILELNNTIIEMKNLLQKINSRSEMPEARISGPKMEYLKLFKLKIKEEEDGRKVNIKLETIGQL